MKECLSMWRNSFYKVYESKIDLYIYYSDLKNERYKLTWYIAFLSSTSDVEDEYETEITHISDNTNWEKKRVDMWNKRVKDYKMQMKLKKKSLL